MTICEKVAYLKGLNDGLALEADSKEAKLFAAMEQGDYDAAAGYLNHIVALRDFFVARDLWPSYSTAMNLLGYEGSFGPDYVCPIQEKYISEIKEELVRIGEL